MQDVGKGRLDTMNYYLCKSLFVHNAFLNIIVNIYQQNLFLANYGQVCERVLISISLPDLLIIYGLYIPQILTLCPNFRAIITMMSLNYF